jgi:hypothetical protein
MLSSSIPCQPVPKKQVCLVISNEAENARSNFDVANSPLHRNTNSYPNRNPSIFGQATHIARKEISRDGCLLRFPSGRYAVTLQSIRPGSSLVGLDCSHSSISCWNLTLSSSGEAPYTILTRGNGRFSVSAPGSPEP